MSASASTPYRTAHRRQRRCTAGVESTKVPSMSNSRAPARRTLPGVSRTGVSGRLRSWYQADAPQRRSALDRYFATILAPTGVEAPLPVQPAVCVRAEIVAQALKQVGGSARTPQPIVVSK